MNISLTQNGILNLIEVFYPQIESYYEKSFKSLLLPHLEYLFKNNQHFFNQYCICTNDNNEPFIPNTFEIINNTLFINNHEVKIDWEITEKFSLSNYYAYKLKINNTEYHLLCLIEDIEDPYLNDSYLSCEVKPITAEYYHKLNQINDELFLIFNQ